MTGIVIQVSISPGGMPNRGIAQAQVTGRGIAGDGIPNSTALANARSC
jgi:hypothetical protein